MSELYHRVLLWHKLVAQVTGGLALCSAKRNLPRTDAVAWAETLRNVSDEIQAVLAGQPFILDDKGRPVAQSGRYETVTLPAPAPKFFNKETAHEVEVACTTAQDPSELTASQRGPQVKKTGGLRVARRKTT